MVLAAGAWTLVAATDGLRAFTSETARRLEILQHPRPLPDVPLEVADGRVLRLADLHGRWLLVDFIYTRCMSFCSVQGGEFARLQDRLAGPIRDGQVVLVSISFDPARDDPAALAAWQRRSGDRGAGWIAARPLHRHDLPALKQAFGVVTVPDALDGWIHNAAIAVVDPMGRLVAILDWNDMDAAAQRVAGQPPP
ncbi:SCO family protein [Dokdonella sp.]|uniref:SCO family protein n=1 Tax=Dokdonella sp. TaxID=2291710 RepID=UPI0031C3C23E|nr:SCO family protein [Dokdonella sp.]